TQLGGCILGRDQCCLQAFAHRRQGGVQLLSGLELASRGSQQVKGRDISLPQSLQSSRAAGEQFLGVREPESVSEQLLFFTRDRFCRVDLVDLELEKIDLPSPVTFVAAERGELPSYLPPGRRSSLNALAKVQDLRSRPGVQQVNMVVGLEQRLVVVLAVQIDE